MGAFFKDNFILVYLFFCISIFNYGVLERKQRIMTIYILSYGLTFSGVVARIEMIILLICILFLYEEYMNTDIGKMDVMRKVKYKILDFLYYYSFKYQLPIVILAIIFSNKTFNCIYPYAKYASLLLMFWAIHQLYCQKFEINSFKLIIEKISEYAYGNQEYYKESMTNKYNLLCDIEDKSFFYRETSYTLFSKEFFRYKYLATTINEGNISSCKRKRLFIKKAFCYFWDKGIRGILNRGYSTIEIQLFKNVAISRGFFANKYVIRRKIFELIYTNAFFEGFKEMNYSNTCTKDGFYKKYIAYVYLHTVPTRINGKYYSTLINALNGKTVLEASMEEMFVLYLGLNMRAVNEKRLSKYQNLINKYNMDESVILETAEKMSK